MVDCLLIEKLIGDVKKYLCELRGAVDITWDIYQKDIRGKRFIERTLHILIEACFDMANHIIADQNFREPANYRDIFTVLCEEKIINESSLPVYDKIASFRNILVHHYEKIDDSIVYGIFKKNLQDFDRFIAEIAVYIENEKP